MDLFVDIVTHALVGFFAFLLVAPILLNYGERARRRTDEADIRARAGVRLAQGEALPYDREEWCR